MNKKKSIRVLNLVVAYVMIAGLIVIPNNSISYGATSSAYKWDNVAIGGGGSVTGIIAHPQVPDLFFARTDVGGAYRWDHTNQRWVNMLNGIPYTEWNLYGAESIAIDPSDLAGNTVYVAAGKYDDSWAVPSRGYIMKSTDRGTTWTRSVQQFAIASNRDQIFGERLAVDPTSGSVVYYASKADGLQRSTDGGANWSQISGAPTGQKLTFTVIDPSGGTVNLPTRSKVVYIGVRNVGVYKSINGGNSFTLLPGSPTLPRRATLDANGTLYVTHDNGVWKYTASAGNDVTPLTPTFGPWSSYGTFAKVNSGQRSDSCAIKLSQNSGSSAVEQSITVSPNTTYTLKGWVKAGTDGQPVYIGVRDYGGSNTSVIITSTNYTEASLTFTTDATHTWAIIYCWKPNTSTGDSYCDDFEVTASSSTTNLVKNPGFENRGAFQAIAVDPFNSNHIIVSTHNWAHSLPMYRSTDGGTNWTEMNMSKNGTVAWWPAHHWRSATSSLVFDRFNQNKVWFTDWYGMWQTSDVTANPSVWENFEKGHEELVTVSNMISPPSGPVKVSSGVADVGGFDHTSLMDFPSQGVWSKGLPTGHTTTGLDFQENNPNFIVRVGRHDWQGNGDGGYSTNGGTTYTPFSSVPGNGGRVAVSATSQRIVWVPQNAVPHYSIDNGATWTASSGAPTGAIGGSNVFVWNYPLASDRVDGNKFYLYKGGIFYRSTDSGANWTIANTSLPNQSWHTVQAAPGIDGEVWISLNGSGLYRSTDSGNAFTKITNVQKAYLFSLGKNAPGRTNPLVFVYGTVDNTEGIFRSDDNGASWVQINSSLIRVGNEPNTIVADRQVYGRVYIGTNGNGIFYGDTDIESPTAPENLTATAVSGSQINLNWTASTDNVRVTGYRIYRDGVEVGTSTVTSFSDTGLTPLTAYSYTVKAYDAVDNLSSASNVVSATTQSPPSEIVIDNTSAEFTGTWNASTYKPNYYGTDYVSNSSGTGADKVRWRPNIYTAGTYQVYYWLPDGDTSRATNAPVTVYFNGGSKTYIVDQRANPGGKWILLGSHSFLAGTTGYVELTDNANTQYVIADAIKFVKQ